jgi:uncharacterized membrane protein YesL
MNFKTATFVWIVLAAFFSVVMVAAYWLLVLGNGNVYAVMLGGCMAMLLFLIAMILYAFPVLSRFTVKGGALLKNAIVMSVKHGGQTIYMLVLTLAFATVVVMGWKFFPLILLIMPGVYTLLLSFIMEKILAIYIPKSGEQDEKPPEEDVSEGEMICQEQEKMVPWYLEGGEQNE